MQVESTPNKASVRALGLFAAGYNVAHHNSLFGTTEVGQGTRLADWIDILTPFVVVGPLLWFLALQRPRPAVWVASVLGGILYVEGHGIHLSSNSIANRASAETSDAATLDLIHLWDEVIGHYLWYVGLAVVVACCITGAKSQSLKVPLAGAVICGGMTGLTWATNALEGGTAVFSLGCAIAACGTAARHRRAGLSASLAAAGLLAVGVIAGYGLQHGGFPQPSAL